MTVVIETLKSLPRMIDNPYGFLRRSRVNGLGVDKEDSRAH